VDLLPSRGQREPSTRVREAMITQVLHCPYCQGIAIVKHGMSPEGKQRYRCRACLEGRGRTLLLEYTYAGQSSEVKQQIVDMAMNARGIRDPARVLHISPTTVISNSRVVICHIGT
jgi:transposase-like protein